MKLYRTLFTHTIDVLGSGVENPKGSAVRRECDTRATSDAVDARMEAIPSEFPRLEVRVDRRDATRRARRRR